MRKIAIIVFIGIAIVAGAIFLSSKNKAIPNQVATVIEAVDENPDAAEPEDFGMGGEVGGDVGGEVGGEIDSGTDSVTLPDATKPDSSKPDTVKPDTTKADAELYAQIDQLFMLGFRGYTFESASDIKKALAETNLGGVILFDYDTPTKKYVRNIQSESQIKKLIIDLQSHSKTKLFVAVDEEGGKVSRMKNVVGFEKTSSAAFLGTQSTSVVQATGKSLGTQLSEYGFNIDFAPDLDVNVNPKNPVIGAVDRSFSADPKVVSEKGIAFIKGLLAGGITPVGKHFPGHGSSTADSHLGFVDITDTYKEYELEPFKDACAAGLPAVMVAHVYDKNVDAKYPATLSKQYLENLKKKAGCSTQLIFSDDMDMRAISSQYGRETALTLAINAGVDVIVISNNVTGYDKDAFFKARKIVFDAVKKGTISKTRIEESYKKIIAFKKKF